MVSPRIAAVHLYALPIESAFPERIVLDEERGEARSVVRRCAVRSDIRGVAVIVDASMPARVEGVRPGMTVTEARARLPELEVRERDVDAELAKLESAAELLLAYGSIVEVSQPAFLFVEVGRSGSALAKVLGGQVSEDRIAEHILETMRAAGHEATVAIAKDPDTARTIVAYLTETRRAKMLPGVEKRREVRLRGRAPAKSARLPKRDVDRDRDREEKESRTKRAEQAATSQRGSRSADRERARATSETIALEPTLRRASPSADRERARATSETLEPTLRRASRSADRERARATSETIEPTLRRASPSADRERARATSETIALEPSSPIDRPRSRRASRSSGESTDLALSHHAASIAQPDSPRVKLRVANAHEGLLSPGKEAAPVPGDRSSEDLPARTTANPRARRASLDAPARALATSETIALEEPTPRASGSTRLEHSSATSIASSDSPRAAASSPPRGTARSSPLRRSDEPPAYVIAADRELSVLARLPVDALLWTDPHVDPDGTKRERLHAASSSLRVLGIHDVARLKTLPTAQLSSRFGEAGALLVARAYARLDRPLRPFTPPERMIEDLELESSVEDLEPILFVLRRLFARLEARLEARALSAGAIVLAFAIEPDLETAIDSDTLRAASSRQIVELELRFARPTRKTSTMLALAREKLGNALPGAVRAVVAEARSPAADFGAQLDLFSNYPRKLEQVGELVGRLEAALGSDAVFSPQVNDTHRPETAWSRRRFEIERALEESSERPARVKKPELAPTAAVLDGATERTGYILPEIDESLCVAEMPAVPEGSVEAVLAELEAKKKSWPKAIERKVEDDPLPQLPPRPLELFDPPERTSLYARREGERDAADSALLVWRGERIPLRSMSGCERLEAEWWTPSPLAREYVVAEAEDGRKLWLFYDTNGDLFMHGIFD